MKNTSNEILIRIHGAYPFDRAAKARWLLTEMGVPFENHWMDLEKKENELPDYLKLHPMGRIPAMQVNDLALFESGAMCSYLADHFSEKGLAPQFSSPNRAKYQQWMYFAACTLDPVVTRIMIIEDIPAGDLRTTKETALLEEFKDALGALDQALTTSSFLVADQFSAADICVGYHLYWISFWPELNVFIENLPQVAAYMDRLKKMPSAIEAKVFTYEN